jgi:hypothetical protein
MNDFQGSDGNYCSLEELCIRYAANRAELAAAKVEIANLKRELELLEQQVAMNTPIWW